MRTFRHAYMLIGLLVVLLLAACGTNTSASKSTSTASATSTPTTDTSGDAYGGGSSGNTPPAATPTPTKVPPKPTPAGTPPVVKTGTAMVNGKATTILTNIQGETLYYLTTDTPTTSTCTGGCAGTWPPLLLTSGTPTSAGSLPGKLTVVTDANGNQVQYNGHFLYAYDGDSAPGQANGEGIGGVWFVVTP